MTSVVMKRKYCTEISLVLGREEKNDQTVPQTFQKATELYSSQFVCCLSTSDGKKDTAALV